MDRLQQLFYVLNIRVEEIRSLMFFFYVHATVDGQVIGRSGIID